jgi:2-hydroxychromene-2-carboxylate isomerase
MAPIQFWFEFASTYSYLAAMRIGDLAAERGVAFTWKPFLLGPIFARQGWNDSPFNLNPMRGAYMWHDVARSCDRYRLPFKKPSVFPRNSVVPARVGCAFADAPWLPEYVRAIYLANFADDRDISDRLVVEEILTTLGLDGAGLIAESQESGAKERLREQTELAWNSGVFGAPTCIVAGELFWGNDRLEDAFDWYLRGQLPNSDAR